MADKEIWKQLEPEKTMLMVLERLGDPPPPESEYQSAKGR